MSETETEDEAFVPIESNVYDEDDQREVYDKLAGGESPTAVSDEVEPSRPTVFSWAEEWGFKEPSGSASGESGASPQDDGVPVAEFNLPGTGSVGDGVDYTQMGPGEFVEWFFEDDLEEVNIKGVALLARRCSRKKAIPTETTMRSILSDYTSGVDNRQTIDWVCEDYWATALDYCEARLGVPTHEIKMQVQQQGAGWLEVTSNQRMARRNNIGQAATGGTVTFDNQPETPRGAGGRTATPDRQTGSTQADGGDVVTISADSPQGTPQSDSNGGVSGQDPMVEMMMQQQNLLMEKLFEKDDDSGGGSDEVEVLREEIRNLKDELSDDDGGNGDDDVISQFKQLTEVQEVMESLTGTDEPRDTEVREALASLQQQFRGLQAQMESDSDTASELPLDRMDPHAAALTTLAQSGALDPESAARLLENSSSSDPDVKSKEIEKEIEMQKMQQNREKWESLVDGGKEAIAEVIGAVSDGELSAGDVLGGTQTATDGGSGGSGGSGGRENRREQTVEEFTASKSGAEKRVGELSNPEPDRTEQDTEPTVEEDASGDGEEEHECGECGESFESEHALRGHMSMHSGGDE
jgi:hypothetical protein